MEITASAQNTILGYSGVTTTFSDIEQEHFFDS
jgi:hypothetical protein